MDNDDEFNAYNMSHEEKGLFGANMNMYVDQMRNETLNDVGF